MDAGWVDGWMEEAWTGRVTQNSSGAVGNFRGEGSESGEGMRVQIATPLFPSKRRQGLV